ncbi:MAG: hypothetical protein GXC73_16335 [Chitinophagaceae bacterium]|nr:hypothetical protein [Chitinophagaceae bacterium]
MKLKQHYDAWLIASIIFCCLLLLVQFILIHKAPWTGDYWEHKAVVREFSVHLQHPLHPILKVDAPHAFFSPYMVLLGAAVSATGIAVSTVLNIAMLVNLLLFIATIYILTGLFIDESKNRSKAFFLLLLFILFFWGPQAPLYSSYLHIRSFVLILSYPSTFSFSCSVFAAGVTKVLLTNNSTFYKQAGLFIILVLLLSLILVCHPLTFAFASSMLLYVYNTSFNQIKFNSKRLINKTLLLFAAGILSLLLAGLWPYYSVFALLKYVNGGNQFHADSLTLYQSLFKQLFPLLLLPVLVFVAPSVTIKREWAWLVSVSVLLAFFVIGYFTGAYGMGRMLAFIFIFCHLLIVKCLISIKQSKAFWFALLFLITIPYLLQTNKTFKYFFSPKVEIVSTSVEFQTASHDAKAQLLSFLEPVFEKKSSVVLTDMSTSLFMPAMGARVVAAVYPVYWVADAEERKKQVQLFFSANATETDRATLINRYKPDYILLTAATSQLLSQLSSFIEPQPVATDKGISLYRIRKSQ